MKSKKIVILFIVVAISFSYLFFFMKDKSNTIETDNVYTKANIVPIAAKVSGYVKEVFIKDNQLVKKGDILFKIVDEDYKIKLELEKVSVDIQKAKIQILEEQISMQKSIVKQVEANLQSVLSSQELANLNFKRAKKLYKNNSASKLKFDEYENAKNKSHFNVIANKNKIEAEKKRLKVLVANKDMTIFQMKQAQVKADLAKMNLKDTSIVAPFDGVIANKQVQVGKYVKATINMLSLVDLKNIWLIANFKETQISELELNQEVEITLDGFKDVTFLGKIDSFSPGSGASFSMLPPNNATGNFVRVVQRVPVKIVFSNTKMIQKLLPGLSAQVSINLGKEF
ncbi:MAG: HlyD family secretion protein [Arcobacteraceae bacterium]|nr:HlyD family secretion protein [Arcobacteraceae bacterium]